MVRRTSTPRDAAELARVLEARLDGTLHEADRVIESPRPAAETLHRLHRELRRLRVGLDVWSRASAPGLRLDLRSFDRRLRRLARLVGGVRDRDVALNLLAQGPSDLPSRERSQVRRLRVRLADDARIGRELLRASLRAERDLGLFEGLRAGFHVPPSARRGRALRAYLDEVRDERQEAIREAHKKARRNPSSRRLHRLRIRVRNWRHIADLASVLETAQPMTVARPLRSLQARLGRLHDLDVVEDLTATAASPSLSRAIRKERRRQHESLVRQLQASHWRQMASPPGLKA
ncbi:MAG: CHAD domain-containing protein [Thermoplasmata archaeon]